MEGDRRLQYILMAAAIVIFGFSYIVGYFVGKEAGFEEAKQKFNIEKQKLLKTIATLSPVSQPRVENKVYVVDKTVEERSENVTDDGTRKEAVQEEKTSLEQKIQTGEKATEKKVTDKIQEQRKEEVFAKQVERKETAFIKEGDYYLQLGVFRNRANAIKLASQLEEKGFKTKTLFADKYTVVIVGYFEHKNEALVAKKLLRKFGYDSILKRRK
ncbi:SPOR domain-containing protein [Desulfurobacterium crinifex]